MKTAYAEIEYRGIGAVVYRYIIQQLGILEANLFADIYDYPDGLANMKILNKDCVRWIYALGGHHAARALEHHYGLDNVTLDMSLHDEVVDRLMEEGGHGPRRPIIHDDPIEQRGIGSIVYQFLLHEIGEHQALGFVSDFGYPIISVNPTTLVTDAIRWLYRLEGFHAALMLANLHGLVVDIDH